MFTARAKTTEQGPDDFLQFNHMVTIKTLAAVCHILPLVFSVTDDLSNPRRCLHYHDLR